MKFDLTKALKEIVNLNTAKKKFTIALENINDVIQIARKIEALPTLRDALMIRNNLNYNDLAYCDLKEFQALNDSLFNEKKTQQIEELKMIYETEKKEAAITLQKEEIKTLNEKAKVYKLSKGLFAFGMFSFIVITGLIYFSFTQRIKKNRIARENKMKPTNKKLPIKREN